MKSKILIVLIGLFVSTTCLFSSVRVTGVIKSSNNDTVRFANVALLNGGQLIKGVISDENGRFELAVDVSDEYVIAISHILYVPKRITIKVNDEDLDLGSIQINTDDKVLKEVNVIAQDVVHKSDRDIVVLSEKYVQQAPNLEQVLQRLPSVSMDLVSRTFRVGNQKNVLMQVNGVVKNEQYIRSLPPSKILKVELIRNVSGRYANDYDAIINIITNKSLTGYTISAEDFTIASFSDDNNDVLKNDISFNYTYFTPKYNVYGGYSNNYNKYKVDEEKIYDYSNGFNVQQRSNAKDNLYSSSMNNLYVGTDFRITPDKVISAELKYSFSPYSNNKQESKNEFSTFNSNTLLNQYSQTNLMEAKNDNPYALVSYEGSAGEKNKINAGVCYYKNNNEFINQIVYDNDARKEEGSSNKNYVDFYVEDYLSLSNKVNVDLNYSYRYQDATSSYKINGVMYPDNINTLNRHNAGAYLNYLINDKSSIKLGSAIESVHLKNESSSYENTDDQFVALPFFAYSNQLSKKVNLRLNYKVNTENPTINELSPFTSVVDSFTTITGNNLLKPSYYHEVKGTIDIAGGLVSIQPFYKFGNDVQSKVGILSNNNIVDYTYVNALDYTKYGFDFLGTAYKAFKNQDMLYFSFGMQKFWEKAQFADSEQNVDDWEVNSQLAYISNKYNAIFAAVLQKSNVRSITAQGYSYNANDFLALSVKKGLFNRKVDLSLTYITPFNGFFTTHIGDKKWGNGFARSNLQDVSVVQNSFLFQLVFNIDRNGDRKNKGSRKKSGDSDKIKTGLL